MKSEFSAEDTRKAVNALKANMMRERWFCYMLWHCPHCKEAHWQDDPKITLECVEAIIR